MIVPSAVSAEISSVRGSDFRSTISEWYRVAVKCCGKFAEDRLVIVMNFAGFSVHHFRRANHPPAKRGADGLMSQADAQHRNFAREALDQRHADASFFRRAGPGRNHDALGRELLDFVERDLIVAANFELLPHLAEVLRQVVGERIVVVEKQDHRVIDALRIAHSKRLFAASFRFRRYARFRAP